MANLADILNKTKGKLKGFKSSRSVIDPAMDDRPYDIIEKENNSDLSLEKRNVNQPALPIVAILEKNLPNIPSFNSGVEVSPGEKADDTSIVIEDRYSIEAKALTASNEPDTFKHSVIEELDKNREIPELKLETNLRQIEDKLETTKNISSIIEKATLPRKSAEKKEKLKVEKREIISPKNKIDNEIDFMQITGLQKQITLYMFGLCKAKRDKVTPPLAVEAIAKACEINKMSIRKTIQRLEEKKVLFRQAYKEGRGGWTQYQLSEIIYQQILHEEQWNVSNTKILRGVKNELAVSPVANVATGAENNKHENTAWDEIDFSDLEKEIAFKKEHLSQLIRLPSMTPEILQNSICHFAHDLKHNGIRNKIQSNPISYFMGIMRKQGVYSPPDNYENPKDVALRHYLKKQQEQEEKRKEMQKALEDIAFNKWVEDLKEEDKQALYSDDVKKIKIQAAQIAFLKTHFIANVWPSIKTDYNPIPQG